MSDEAIIRVENLGKRYSLRHETGERYTALRDVIARKAASLFRRNGRGRARKNLTSDLRPLTSDLRGTREDFWALKDVSFEVKRGEVVGIIGRNGAGKSTLLKILSRITDPTEGKVTLKGRVASLLEVGTGFHAELTGRENIYLNGAILGMSRVEIRAKFDEIVSFAEIEKFLDTPVKRYSSGMYVRLAFAVAAHLEPEILLVDEVLAVGDAAFQKKCLGKMREVAEGHGRTVLFVSHNMGTVCTICARAFLLERGRISQSGATGDVVQSYLSSRQTVATERSRAFTTHLDDNLDLVEFSIRHPTIRSGDGLEIQLRLRAKDSATTVDLALQLTSLTGVRLAEWDLRHPKRRLQVAPDRDATVSISIPCLPLVEGSYMFSLFHRTARTMGDHAALAELTVVPGQPISLVPPVPADYRGFFEIPYKFDFETGKAASVRND